MGVYIPGMEMPATCEKCPFLDYEEGFCFASVVKHESGWYESTLCPGGIKDGRHDDCPLVPVPEHGRLIDADKIPYKKIMLDDDDEFYYGVTQPYIDRMPTIIQAEPQEEES